MNQLMKIDNVKIRQDEAGRYSLNDLHKAAGSLEKDKPAKFIRHSQTQDLINELKQVPYTALGLKIIHGGSHRGTYVCKELVYAYAMWVNPRFHLKVIRTFDSVVTSKPETSLESLPTITVKYYRGKPVLLANDLAQLFQANISTIRYCFKRAGFTSDDFELLVEGELRHFKAENKIMSTTCNSIAVIYESGFKKLQKYFSSNVSSVFPAALPKTPVVKTVKAEFALDIPNNMKMQNKIKKIKELTIGLSEALSSYGRRCLPPNELEGALGLLGTMAWSIGIETSKLSDIKPDLVERS